MRHTHIYIYTYIYIYILARTLWDHHRGSSALAASDKCARENIFLAQHFSALIGHLLLFFLFIRSCISFIALLARRCVCPCSKCAINACPWQLQPHIVHYAMHLYKFQTFALLFIFIIKFHWLGIKWLFVEDLLTSLRMWCKNCQVRFKMKK